MPILHDRDLKSATLAWSNRHLIVQLLRGSSDEKIDAERLMTLPCCPLCVLGFPLSQRDLTGCSSGTQGEARDTLHTISILINASFRSQHKVAIGPA